MAEVINIVNKLFRKGDFFGYDIVYHRNLRLLEESEIVSNNPNENEED